MKKFLYLKQGSEPIGQYASEFRKYHKYGSETPQWQSKKAKYHNENSITYTPTPRSNFTPRPPTGIELAIPKVSVSSERNLEKTLPCKFCQKWHWGLCWIQSQILKIVQSVQIMLHFKEDQAQRRRKDIGYNPSTPTPLLSRSACSRGVRGCLCPDGLFVSIEPKTSPFNNPPRGEILGSRLTNNPSEQRQPLTPWEQADRDRRGVGVVVFNRAAAHRPQPLFCLRQLAPVGVRGCVCPDGLLVSLEPKTSDSCGSKLAETKEGLRSMGCSPVKNNCLEGLHLSKTCTKVPELDINFSLGLRLRLQVLAMLVMTLSFTCYGGGIVMHFDISSAFGKDHKNYNAKLEVVHVGTNEVKETKIGLLNLNYENFKLEPNEDIKAMFNRFSIIINELKGFRETIPEDKLVKKLIYSVL
ncbi:hypothetical protein GQ457_06G011770 [Hibiscus cannabinus]